VGRRDHPPEQTREIVARSGRCSRSRASACGPCACAARRGWPGSRDTGTSAILPETIFGVAPEHWGEGLAAEAGRALLRYAVEEPGFAEMRGSTDAPDAASVRVMEKRGMRFERRATVGGLDAMFYAITREDWAASGGS